MQTQTNTKEKQIQIAGQNDIFSHFTWFLDRSQSLFYFIPQEKRLTQRPPWTWKNMGDSIFPPENVNIWPETGQNRVWPFQISISYAIEVRGASFPHQVIAQIPCKGLGEQASKYVRANHSTAYFSSLKIYSDVSSAVIGRSKTSTNQQ